LTAASTVVLVGFAALTIDVGYMYSVRLDLQNAADAAALTAAGAYASDDGVTARNGNESALYKLHALALERAGDLGALNASIGKTSTKFETDDVTLGFVEVSSTEPLNPTADVRTFNAVRVLARRDQIGPNGAVELFFSRVFGYAQTDVTASAVAAFDDRVAIVAAPTLLPFTIDEDIFAKQVTEGDDNYEYDADAESVSNGSDDVPEVHLYAYDNAPGNFGLLNIGPGSGSESDLAYQILHDIPSEHLEMTFGSTDFHFLDDDGDPAAYPIPGNPGFKAGLEDALQSRIGDIVGIFLHNAVQGNGSNTQYTVVSLRYVRVMAVNLGGNPKYVRVQPVVHGGEDVILGANAPGTDGLIGNIVLAR
jgi:hypothetical protein